MISKNPILNNPYYEPELHYATDSDGNLDYLHEIKGRRIFKEDLQAMPNRNSGGQKEMYEWNNDIKNAETHIINLCRKQVRLWKNENYPNTTRVTKELLTFWFKNTERLATEKLFFAQQEAIETAIWLNEVAEMSNPGQHILSVLKKEHESVSTDFTDHLPRIAFKMATGTGKTVVMACFILYHFYNRQEYRNDTRFADYFLIVAPGITIKDRLGVLYVDTKNKNPVDIVDYYRVRKLVPQNKIDKLEGLNAKLVITNYHTFEPKTLQGNKRSPFDGKVDLEGNKIKTENTENFSQVLKRTLSAFKTGSRILILNDEAHHCYLPKSKGKIQDFEDADENKRAAVWFTGLKEIAKRYKVQSVYDLSATPYYLHGSGHEAYKLFPWVVTDFGLIEAIESGLVKIPFLPETDNTQNLTMPQLRNLYVHVKDDLSKQGVKKRKAKAREEGETLKELPPEIPALVKGALDQFYNHYEDYFKGYRKKQESKTNLFTAPPVFILVCNNTSVSKEMYKYIAGYEYEDASGKMQYVIGAKDLFSNYNNMGQPLKKPPTLLIDSDALENSEQVNDDFKKIFVSEIEEFKNDFVRIHGHGSIENITDAQILREVVNTVGKPNKLGAHIRCVVSVSMLTEGWDANTVTHIMGLRAFGSQLLCEQVAGRALRRMDYFLQGYDIEGNPTTDKRKIVIEKFPPEYAHIIGVPFKMFKGGETATPPTPEDRVHIMALPERQKEFEITFPNLKGYKTEFIDGVIQYDFTDLEDFEIDYSNFPTETTMKCAFTGHEEVLQVKSVFEKRDNEIIYNVTKELLKLKFVDDEGNKQFQKFNKLKKIVTIWYETKINIISVLNKNDIKFKRLLYFIAPNKYVEHIARGINTKYNTSEYIRPVFNYYNQFGSSSYVNGNTIKNTYATKKSHVNYVVADTETWEQICAKALEELPEVICYVKNHYLDFVIPYIKNGEDKKYYPDFIAKCKTQTGKHINLIIEITGMNTEKAEKKYYTENRWLPAVNSMKDKYKYNEWHFIEIAGDIRDIKSEILNKLVRCG